MSWDKVPPGGRLGAIEPLKAGERQFRKNRFGEVDGRAARWKGKRKQFNPRVPEKFVAEFEELQAELQEQSALKVTQAYVLELLLASFQRGQGRDVNPFGLSDEAMQAAELISEHNQWSVAEAVEDALSARLKHFKLLPNDEPGRRR